MHQKKFQLSSDAAERAVNISGSHVEAMRVLTLVQYVSNGDDRKGKRQLKRLVEIMMSSDKVYDVEYYFLTSRIFARQRGRDKQTLELTLTLISRACDLDPSNTEVQNELAYQYQMLGRYDESTSKYQFASSVDQNNLGSFCGIILNQILKGNLDDAKEQMEFLSCVQDDEDEKRDLKILYVEIFLGEEINNDYDTKSNLLLDLIIHQINQLTIDKVDAIKFYSSLDLFFIGKVLKITVDRRLTFGMGYLNESFQDLNIKNVKEKEYITKAITLLNLITEWCPSYLDGLYSLFNL